MFEGLFQMSETKWRSKENDYSEPPIWKQVIPLKPDQKTQKVLETGPGSTC